MELNRPVNGAGIPPNCSHGEALAASSLLSESEAAAGVTGVGPEPTDHADLAEQRLTV